MDNNGHKFSHYVSGKFDGTNTGFCCTCDHKHRTQSAALKCAAERRKNDGMIVAFAVDVDGEFMLSYNEVTDRFERTIQSY